MQCHPTLAVADGDIYLWDIEEEKQIPFPRGVGWSVAFSPDGKIIASADHGWEDNDYMVRLWDSESGEQIAVLEGHDEPITSLAFSPDGRTLASGAGDPSMPWKEQEDNTVRL